MAGGAVADMLTSLALNTFTPCCPGKKTVVYPLFANVATLISAPCFIPGTTIASLAPLESARVDSIPVFVALSVVPPAVTTTLSDGPVSCSPIFEFTNVFDAPESNIASVMASVKILSSRRFAAWLLFLRSSLRAQRSANVDLGREPEWTAEKNGLW
jgi:hypothetical protein